jgi:hypothetical protein
VLFFLEDDMNLKDRMIRVVGMKRLAISAIAFALMTAPASAQIKRLKCEFSNGTPPKLIIIDYGAKTLTTESLDQAGNVDPVTVGAGAGLANLPAIFTSESISAQSQRQCGIFTAVLNRRSGSLVLTFCAAPIVTKPCVPYIVGPQKF